MAYPEIFYLVQSLRDLPEDEAWLCDGESYRAAGMRFAKRRQDWILGRWTAKCALRAMFQRTGRPAPAYSELEIRSAADGAPEACLKGAPAPASISLSHSGGVGFCVVAPAGITIGCDLEVIQPHDANFLEDYLLADERDAILRGEPARHPLLATLVWSAKESALKCLREGLRRDTRSVRIRIDDAQPGGWNSLDAHCLETGRVFHGWWRQTDPFVQTITGDVVTPLPVELARTGS